MSIICVCLSLQLASRVFSNMNIAFSSRKLIYEPMEELEALLY